MKEKLKKVGKILLKIVIILTSPVWFIWKVLFVRKPEKKFKNMPTRIKVWRVIRSFVTKPLKFAVFLFIIGLEVVIVYKVRYSPVTYVITRSSVQNYYLKEETVTEKFLGIKPVMAAPLQNHREEFKTTFAYIDEWDLSAKNKAYVLLDATLTKRMVEYIDDETLTYLLTKFNTDETFREDVRFSIDNINKTLSRGLREIPTDLDFGDATLNSLMSPITSISSVAVDYRTILDAAMPIFDYALKESSVKKNSMHFDQEDLDFGLDLILYYSKGASLEELEDQLGVVTHTETTTSVVRITNDVTTIVED